MPVYTFNSHDDARKALWNFNPGPEYYKQVSQLFDLAFRLCKPKGRKGVIPFKSIDEARAFRERELIESAKISS